MVRVFFSSLLKENVSSYKIKIKYDKTYNIKFMNIIWKTSTQYKVLFKYKHTGMIKVLNERRYIYLVCTSWYKYMIVYQLII